MSVPLVSGGLLSTLAGAPLRAVADVGLSAVSAWVVAGAVLILGEVIKLVSVITTPTLAASWFSGTYWRLSGLALVLTVPFLCAAAVQAIVRSDLGLLLRAALFDLPVALIATALAAPVITLLLAGTDEMCAFLTGGHPLGRQFLTLTATDLDHAGGGVLLALIAFVILLAGMGLVVELILRAAAIYAVVLFLPIGFAAMLWPARRIWIRRMLETLVALILSKLAMVAILTLAVSALAAITTDPSALTSALTAMALLILSVFAPWALLRLLPFTELAHDATRHLRSGIKEGYADSRKLAGTTAGLGMAVGTEMVAGPAADAMEWMRRATTSSDAIDGGGRALAVLGGSGSGELPPPRAGGGSEDAPPLGPGPGGPGPGGPGHGVDGSAEGGPGPEGDALGGPRGVSRPAPDGAERTGSAGDGPAPPSASAASTGPDLGWMKDFDVLSPDDQGRSLILDPRLGDVGDLVEPRTEDVVGGASDEPRDEEVDADE